MNENVNEKGREIKSHSRVKFYFSVVVSSLGEIQSTSSSSTRLVGVFDQRAGETNRRERKRIFE